MGRKKLSETLEEVAGLTEQQESQEETTELLEKEGLSVFTDGKGRYHVVQLKYNPLTKRAIVDKITEVDSRFEAQNMFKTLTIEKGLFE